MRLALPPLASAVSAATFLSVALAAVALVASTAACSAAPANELDSLPVADAHKGNPNADPSADPNANAGADAPPADPTEPLAPETDPDPDQGATDQQIDDGVGMAMAPPTPKPLPAIPAACDVHAKVVTYTPVGFGKLVSAFESDLSPCADYYMFLPALVADKTQPRGPAGPQDLHARTGRFFATAEVHWQTWKNVTGMTWYERGVEFRKRMAAAGYDAARGDTWAINELPSTIRTDAATRIAARNLVRGLYDGPPGAPKRAGIVFVIGFGQGSQNVSVLKANTKDWLEDAPFWQDMDGRVLSWSQETYADPALSCVDGASVGARASHVNDFGMYPAKLAIAGAGSTAAAKKFFDGAYNAVVSGSWKQPLYGNTLISLDAMKHFVSLGIYAQRAFGATHAVPDGRVGLSFHNSVDGATDAEVVELAQRTAAAIHGAYGIGGKAANACSPSGAYTWCDCALPNAAFTEIWKAFETY
jgi:hypothetical protein